MNKPSFSSLNTEQKREWLEQARKFYYPGLEPTDPAKESLIPAKARELYYDADDNTTLLTDNELDVLMAANYDL